MALTTARISSSRWRPPGLGGGIKSLIRSHSASVRSVGYGLAVIPPVYRTGATYGRLFKQPLKTLERVVLEVARALHGKIGAVELQGQAPGVDKLIFALHLPGERHDIVLVGIIVGIYQSLGDNARGGGRHKRLDKGLRLLCWALVEERARLG